MIHSKKTVFQVILLLIALLFVSGANAQNNTEFEIKVTCLSSDEENKPLDNVYLIITYIDGSYKAEQVAWTLSNGTANIKLSKSGSVEIQATKKGYEKALANIELSSYEQKSFDITINIIKFKKTEEGRNIDINVFGKDSKGNIVPIQNAAVSTYSGTNYTNSNGFTKILHKVVIGETIPIRVSAMGYETIIEAFVVGSSKTSLTSNNDYVSVTLEPSKLETFTLKVLVLDSADDKPVPNSTVELRMRTPYEGKTTWAFVNTDIKGEARFDGVPYIIAQNSLYIAARNNTYKEKWSDLNAELLENKMETERNFTIYIAKENTQPGELTCGEFEIFNVMFSIDGKYSEQFEFSRSMTGCLNACMVQIDFNFKNPFFGIEDKLIKFEYTIYKPDGSVWAGPYKNEFQQKSEWDKGAVKMGMWDINKKMPLGKYKMTFASGNCKTDFILLCKE